MLKLLKKVEPTTNQTAKRRNCGTTGFGSTIAALMIMMPTTGCGGKSESSSNIVDCPLLATVKTGDKWGYIAGKLFLGI